MAEFGPKSGCLRQGPGSSARGPAHQDYFDSLQCPLVTQWRVHAHAAASSAYTCAISSWWGAGAAGGWGCGHLYTVPASGKATLRRIPTYTGISQDNQACDLSLDILVYVWTEKFFVICKDKILLIYGISRDKSGEVGRSRNTSALISGIARDISVSAFFERVIPGYPHVCMLKIADYWLVNAQIARTAIWISSWKLYCQC